MVRRAHEAVVSRFVIVTGDIMSTETTARSFRWPVTSIFLYLLLIWASSASAQPGNLTFFKNYTVTGDYVVAGVNLRNQGVNGFATGEITITGVPAGADILAAFLYSESVETPNSGSGMAGATFRDLSGQPNDISGIARIINPQGTAPCWSSGGGTGGSNGAHKAFVYRTDVLRFLRNGPDGKKLANTTFEIVVPDAGTGNSVPSAGGASLVIVYRVADNPTVPLRTIVIYNGGYTMDNSTQMMTQTLQGFYQASTTVGAQAAKLTHIVADGSLQKQERLLFASGATTSFTTANVVGGDAENPSVDPANPFVGAASASPDPAWDNLTVNVSSKLLGNSSSVTTRVDHVGSTFDCLTWGAIIFSTTVQDTDNDGIVDAVELSSPTN